MSSIAARLRRYQDPAYTGPNRCGRCTAVNAVITVLLAALAGANGLVFVAPWAGAIAAAAVLAVGAVAIYFKGFLVPGTPALTKRYFPEQLLGWFGKAGGAGGRGVDGAASPAQGDGGQTLAGAATGATETGAGGTGDSTTDEEAAGEELEALFVEHGLLEIDPERDDLRLTAEFRQRWLQAMDDQRAAEDALAAVLDDDPDGVTFHAPPGQSTIRATGANGGIVATWPSGAAVRADGAAAAALAGADWFADVEPRARAGLLRSLRLFLEDCPACGGAVTLDEETVESCCSTYEVYAATCVDCDARLLELRA